MRSAIVTASLLVGACATLTETVERSRLSAPPPVERDGLAIEVLPISLKEMRDHPELVVPVGAARWGVAAGPLFRVTLSNSSPAPVRLTLALADRSGTRFPLWSKSGLKAHQANLIAATAGSYDAGNAEIADLTARVHQHIERAPLFEPETELAPGGSRTSFALFNLPPDSQIDQNENARWVAAHQPFQLVVEEVGAPAPRLVVTVQSRAYSETYEDGRLRSP